jgi:hypothetical protein
MRFLLLKIWPALLPVALYVLWLLLRRRKAKRAGEDLPTLLSGPWLQTLGVALLLATISLFYLGLSAEKNAGAAYTPKKFENGKLIDGELK